MRTLIDYLPFVERDKTLEWYAKGQWPFHWIARMDMEPPPYVAAYRRIFTMDRQRTVRVHVSADERYELYLDGRMIGRGSERGDAANWYFETYDLPLRAGEHVIVAKVWSLGEMAPYAQMSVRHGFICAPQDQSDAAMIGTGTSAWQARRIDGITFTDPRPAFGTGANVRIDAAAFPWGFETGGGEGWRDAAKAHAGTNGIFRNEIGSQHLMRPAVLGPMLDQPIAADSMAARYAAAIESTPELHKVTVRLADNLPGEQTQWNGLAGGGAVVVPRRTRRRIIFDLNNYFCAYPELVVSKGKGSRVSLKWAESLFVEPEARNKANRDEIEGKYFLGVGDEFLPDGGDHRSFKTLWWQAGRYLQLCVETTDEPLTIHRLHLRETRYPLEMESRFTSDDRRINDVIPPAFRSLQMCAHETYLDCPYYEQLMYSGDSRLAGLTTLVATRDDALLRKCIEQFDYSRTPSGLTQSRYPSRVRQVLAPFSLFWISMIHDYALWRGDADFVSARMRGARGVIEWYLGKLNRDGLVEIGEGWNFTDWVPSWTEGVHPGMEYGPSGIMNLHLIYALSQAAAVEQWLGETELVQRYRRLSERLTARVTETFWDDRRGLFADDIRKTSFSEHAQCLAVLSGALDDPRRLRQIRQGLIESPDLARTTISYTHYLFETYRRLDWMEGFFRRMRTWFELPARGMRTTPEWPEPTRSDCHGWGAHPIHHFFATILGIRPAEMGFGKVSITPNLGTIKQTSGRLVHPKGWIEIDLATEARSLRGIVSLPEGVDGSFSFGGQTQRLTGGKKHQIEIMRP
jgi:hypothetical protein